PGYETPPDSRHARHSLLGNLDHSVIRSVAGYSAAEMKSQDQISLAHKQVIAILRVRKRWPSGAAVICVAGRLVVLNQGFIAKTVDNDKLVVRRRIDDQVALLRVLIVKVDRQTD